MAYRNISVKFWSDRKVRDEFSRDEKFAYLYLMTSPQTNICGCYELSRTETEIDFGMKWAEIEKLLSRLEQVHKVIRYDRETKEVLILKWGKYNWSKSEKLLNAVRFAIKDIKSKEFRTYVEMAIEAKSMGEEVKYDFTETVDETEHAVAKPAKEKRVTITEIVKEKQFPEQLEIVVLEWVKYKVQQRKPYKEIGLRNLLSQIQKRCDGYGIDEVVRVIELSMANNWQGICWEKLEQKPTSVPNRLRGLDTW